MKALLITISIFISFSSFSQDYLDHIAEETCDCLGNIDRFDTYEEFTMALGLCMIEESEPFKKKLKKDFDIDFNKLDEYGEKLGLSLAGPLINHCPNFLDAFSKFDTEVLEDIAGSNNSDTQNSESSLDFEDSETYSLRGTVKSHKQEGFLSIRIEDESGGFTKVYWLDFVESNYDLGSGLENLIDSKVKITLTQKELYDIRSNEYRFYKVLKSLDIIE